MLTRIRWRFGALQVLGVEVQLAERHGEDDLGVVRQVAALRARAAPLLRVCVARRTLHCRKSIDV